MCFTHDKVVSNAAVVFNILALLQDYYNLVDVYLDAVLQPRCVTDPKTFAQEGWHYELDDAKVVSAR